MRHLKAICYRGVGNNNLLYCLICKGCNDCCLCLHGWTKRLDCTFLLLVVVDYNNNNIISTTNSAKSVKALEQLMKVTCAVVHGPSSLPIQPHRQQQAQPSAKASNTNQRYYSSINCYYLLHPIHPWHSTDTRTYGQNWSDLICSGLAACKCVCGACTYVCVDIHSVVSMQAQMHP